LGGAAMDTVQRNGASMVIVVGSESHGISGDVQALLSHRISIPKPSGSPTESLNATVAASILMYHFQRGKD
jgi:TrmH family RNA methyltransferase